MKIDYPQIDWNDVQAGDTVLAHQFAAGSHLYREFTVADPSKHFASKDEADYYLIDRPKPAFPEESGTFIIAKKVRGVEFPEGIVLRRNAATKSYNAVYWISDEQVPDVGQYGRTRTYDRHPESKIEGWVLAKVVPA